MAQLIYTFKLLLVLVGCLLLLSIACSIIIVTINTIKENHFKRKMLNNFLKVQKDDIAFYNENEDVDEKN